MAFLQNQFRCPVSASVGSSKNLKDLKVAGRQMQMMSYLSTGINFQLRCEREEM